jgi:hypothetical protein
VPGVLGCARSISRNRNRIIITWLCQYNFSYKNTDPGISSTDIAHKSALNITPSVKMERGFMINIGAGGCSVVLGMRIN